MDTKMKSRGLICSVLLGGLVAGAHAQMFGSFWRMTSINGITVTRSGLTYDVTLSSNSNDRYVTFVNHLNQVQTEYFNQVMGFFKVGDGVQLLGANGSNTFTNGATWKWYPDQDKVAGWTANANPDRLNGGETASFTYSSLVGGTGGPPSWVTNGFHLVFANSFTLGGKSGDTYYVTTGGGQPPNNVVPEPFTMGLGIAAAGAFIRRRTQAKKQ